MSTFTAPTRFAGQSLYAVLNVEVKASTDDIRRAYRRAALKYHPDHNHSPDANDEFAYLAHAHDILSNTSTRTLYDETGILDSSPASSSASSSDSTASSAEYWRSVFPQVSAEEIEAFRDKYVGSEEEIDDIKAAYQRYEGNIQHVLESIPFAEADSVPRLCELLNQHCRARITAAQMKRVQRKAEEWQKQERAEFEQLAINGSEEAKEAAKAAGDMTQLVALLTRRKEEAKEKQEQWLAYMGEKYAGGATKGKGKLKGKVGKAAGKGKAGKADRRPGDEEEAEEEEKEGKEEKEDGDEPSEEEFQRIQAEMLKRREEKKANDAKGSATKGKKMNDAAERGKKRRKTVK